MKQRGETSLTPLFDRRLDLPATDAVVEHVGAFAVVGTGLCGSVANIGREADGAGFLLQQEEEPAP